MSYATKPLALDETLGRVADALGGGSVQTQSRFENVNKSIAPLFDSTQTYATGSLVMHDDKLYKCTTTHTGAWDETHFTLTSVVSEGGSPVDIANNAGAHNSIFRGQSLGTSVTADQYITIQSGTFNDMFIGDYWTINSIVYRIAAFDYWFNTGPNNGSLCTDHHVVLVPDDPLYTSPMNDTATTTGGYVGSKMYTTYLDSAKTTINAAFGSSHILSHKEAFINQVNTTNGTPQAFGWYDSTVDLMNEQMVYGGYIFGIGNFGVNTPCKITIDRSQLPLFKLAPYFRVCQTTWWLRDNTDAERFANVISAGQAGGQIPANTASYSVRPAFAIH